MLTVEHEFILPMGLVDEDGTLHREGVMRLATAADEILPLADPRVQRNPGYLSMILFSRVVTSLGDLHNVTPKTIESLFAADLSYLQTLYNQINGLEEGVGVICPECRNHFVPEDAPAGGFSATPSIG
jgi:hypothetical protein